MADALRVEVDDAATRRALTRLADGLDEIPDRVGYGTAQATAALMRARVPVRSGRLRSTVDALVVTHGGAVTYGGTLPYARYIERRAHAVTSTVPPSIPVYVAAMRRAAEQEVARI
jgi:hypothetical protein